MKITEEVLANGEWISDKLFKYPKNKINGKYPTKYVVMKCKNCGNDCLVLPKNQLNVFCDANCHLTSPEHREVARKSGLNSKGYQHSEESKKKMSKSRKGRQFKDLTNKRFGRLIALNRTRQDDKQTWHWLCRCDCGNFKEVKGVYLSSGHVKSCGCLI